MTAAKELDKRVASINFKEFFTSEMKNADVFYRCFCFQLAQELELEDDIDDHWSRYRKAGNNSCCAHYLRRYLLPTVPQRMVIALDELEVLIDAPFRTEFFGMLRNWHNLRAFDESMRRVDLVLVSSTEPYALIEDLNQSPFNVGERIKLQDFSSTEVANLNQRHGFPFTESELTQLQQLIGGHPYLVRQALYQVAKKQQTPLELLSNATTEGGAFGEHLRRHRMLLERRPDLAKGMRQIVQGYARQVPKSVTVRLESAGLVRSETRLTVPRCELYRVYFQESFS